jgi:hypothetical protein
MVDFCKINSLLGRELNRLLLMENGNEEDSDQELVLNFDLFDEYVDDIIQTAVDEYNTDEDDIWSAFVSFVEKLAEDGDLPEFPEESEDDKEFGDWLTQAKKIALKERFISFLESD